MTKVFISYRRDDSQYVTDSIHDHMSLHFGEENVFLDVGSIPFGVDFRHYLSDQIAAHNVVLVIIGPDWTRMMKERANQQNDFVRVEIESALSQDKLVIPVLVMGAKMPAFQELPESIADLQWRNSAIIRRKPDLESDCKRLAESIKSVIQNGMYTRASTQSTQSPTKASNEEIPSNIGTTESDRNELNQKMAVTDDLSLQQIVPQLDKSAESSPHPWSEALFDEPPGFMADQWIEQIIKYAFEPNMSERKLRQIIASEYDKHLPVLDEWAKRSSRRREIKHSLTDFYQEHIDLEQFKAFFMLSEIRSKVRNVLRNKSEKLREREQKSLILSYSRAITEISYEYRQQWCDRNQKEYRTYFLQYMKEFKDTGNWDNLRKLLH